MAKVKIYSQASNDVVISKYLKKGKNDIVSSAQIEKAIVIKGGANVAFSDTDKVQRNVRFALTEVSEEELAILQANASFMRKVERGFITIAKEPKELKADKSAQISEKKMKEKHPKVKVTAEDEI